MTSLPDLLAASLAAKVGRVACHPEGGRMGQLAEGRLKSPSCASAARSGPGEGRQGQQHVRPGPEPVAPVEMRVCSRVLQRATGVVLVVLARRGVGQGQGGPGDPPE